MVVVGAAGGGDGGTGGVPQSQHAGDKCSETSADGSWNSVLISLFLNSIRTR